MQISWKSSAQVQKKWTPKEILWPGPDLEWNSKPDLSPIWELKNPAEGVTTRAKIAQLVSKFRSGLDRIFHMWPGPRGQI